MHMLPDTNVWERLKKLGIRQHMHQIIIDMICSQALQLRIKIFVQIFRLFHEHQRQFRGDIYFIPEAMLLQSRPEEFLTA